MDQETKDMISNIQQAIWKLEQANELLDKVPGFGDYSAHLVEAITDLTAELEELNSLEVK